MLGFSTRIVAVAAVCFAFLSGRADAQGRNAAQALRKLSVDSIPGAITAFYSRGHEERARTLQTRYTVLVQHYEHMFAGDSALQVKTDLAILAPAHWSAVVARPYGLPNIDFTGWPRLVAFLPATNDTGLMADVVARYGLTSKLDIARAVDVVGLHEFGHGLTVKYLYVLAPGITDLSVRWFDEFMATYFGQGHLWYLEGLAADPFTADLVASVVPKYTSLADFDAHYNEFQTPAGFDNYGWYQAQLTERARAVFAKQGLQFVKRVRNELPWERYATWRTDVLLGWLEKIEPGFIAWAASLTR